MHTIQYTNGDYLAFVRLPDLLRDCLCRYPDSVVVWAADEECLDDTLGVVFENRVLAMRLDLSLSGFLFEPCGSVSCPTVATISSPKFVFEQASHV